MLINHGHQIPCLNFVIVSYQNVFDHTFGPIWYQFSHALRWVNLNLSQQHIMGFLTSQRND